MNNECKVHHPKEWVKNTLIEWIMQIDFGILCLSHSEASYFSMFYLVLAVCVRAIIFANRLLHFVEMISIFFAKQYIFFQANSLNNSTVNVELFTLYCKCWIINVDKLRGGNVSICTHSSAGRVCDLGDGGYFWLGKRMLAK